MQHRVVRNPTLSGWSRRIERRASRVATWHESPRQRTDRAHHRRRSYESGLAARRRRHCGATPDPRTRSIERACRCCAISVRFRSRRRMAARVPAKPKLASVKVRATAARNHFAGDSRFWGEPCVRQHAGGAVVGPGAGTVAGWATAALNAHNAQRNQAARLTRRC